MTSPLRHLGPLLAALGLGGCAAGAAEAPPPPLVVLVSLDTTRADRMGGPYGNPRGLTPNLDAFAQSSTVFTDAWSVSNLTSMAHAALFTSRYPSEVGVVSGEFHLDGKVATLADLFHLYGWQTAAFTSGGHLTRSFGLDRGFDVFDNTPFMGSLWHTVPASLDWLDHGRSSGPALLFVHGYDAHTPYLAPAPFGSAWMNHDTSAAVGDQVLATRLGSELIFGDTYFTVERMLGFLPHRNRPRLWDAEARAAVAAEARRIAAQDPHQVLPFGEADTQRVRDGYDGAIAYEDAMFGELVSGLRRRGLYDSAWIVVFADHGESLGEEGRFGHGESLAPAQLHVPLYIHAPGGTAHVVTAPVSTLDVLPTLCEALSFTPPAQARGASLLPWVKGETGPSHATRFAEGNLGQSMAASAGAELVFEGLRPGSPYYDAGLATAALLGPAFRDEGTPTDASAREALRAAMQGWRSTLAPASFAEPASPQAVEAMKANGYFTP